MKPQKGVKNAKFVTANEPNTIFAAHQQTAGRAASTAPSAPACTATGNISEDPLIP